MTKIEPNHAEALRICASVLPDFEVSATGNTGGGKTIVLWPNINTILVSFDNKTFGKTVFLKNIASIRQIGRLGLRVNEIGWYACYAEFTLQGGVIMNKNQKIEWAINELKNCQKNPDKESAHGHADYVLCELLSKIGCQAVVDEYEKVDGWYA